MVGQKQIGRSIDVGHNIALVEAQAIEQGDRMMLEQVQIRECLNAGNSPSAQEMCRGQVEIEARSLALRRRPRRRSDHADAARPVRRPADDRRAEDADPDLRGVRAVTTRR